MKWPGAPAWGEWSLACRAVAGEKSLAADVDSRADRRERRIGIFAEGGDGADAHHDNEGQHDRVLNSRRAVFASQELRHEMSELLHSGSPFGSRAIRR